MKNLMIGALLVAVLSLPGLARADDKPTKKPDAPTTINLDVSKLPPELVAQLLKLAADAKKPDAEAKPEKKPDAGAKPVKKPDVGAKPAKKAAGPAGAHSLGQAVNQVEKAGKGTVTKAERVGDVFVLEVMQGDNKETVKIEAIQGGEGKKKGGPEGGKKKGTPDAKKGDEAGTKKGAQQETKKGEPAQKKPAK
jgi:hypothetical protein